MGGLSDTRVLVTGAGGFIGGHLVERLVREGAQVRAFVRYTSRGDHGTLDWIAPEIVAQVEVVNGELRDIESVDRAVEGVDVVFHLGAQIAIPYSYVNPRDYVEVNVLGTLNVAQAALRHSVRRVVQTSTSEVYGTARTVPITEDHPLEPGRPTPRARSRRTSSSTAFTARSTCRRWSCARSTPTARGSRPAR